jgi:type III secretion protein T
MNSSLLVDIHNVLLAVALVTPRALVCLVILPGFGVNVLTGMAKNTAAMAMVLPAAVPTFYFVRETPPDMLVAFLLLFKEAAIGLMFGLLMSIPIWVAQSVGSILDTQRSPIQLQSNNASLDRDASATGAMLLQAVALVMVQAGLFVAMARILIESYGAWPAYTLMPPFEPGHFDVLVKRFGELFWYIVVYGAPVIIPLLMVDFAFALMGVFASNLQVSFASSPIKSITGIFILLIYWPTLSHYAAGDFSHMLDLAASLLQVQR